MSAARPLQTAGDEMDLIVSIRNRLETAGDWRFRRDVTAIVVAGIVVNLILIAIPGFYSHDELVWQTQIARRDHAWSFFLGSLTDSPFFRLFGTLFISASLRLPLQPMGAHLAEVLLCIATAVLLYLATRLFEPGRALAVAILFMLMPGYAYCAGWIAAGFDVQYTFCGVAAILCAVLYWRGGSLLFLVMSLAAFAIGLGCKETALSIPICGALVAIADRRQAIVARLAMLAVFAGALAALYLGIRANRILEMGHAGDGGYSFGNLAQPFENALAYFGFPFSTGALEIEPFPISKLANVLKSAGPHIILLAMILWRGGPSWALLYLAAFYATVLPVLPISKYETQYTYASSIALALALAFVWDRRLLAALPVLALSLLLAWHGFAIQGRMYQTGLCQTRALAALHALVPALAPSKPLNLLISDDGPWWVVARAVNQKDAFPLNGGYARVSVTRDAAEATMVFEKDCSVVLKVAE